MRKRTLLSFASLFLFFLMMAINSTYGQTYTSAAQSHMSPDGTSKFAYHPATVIFFNNNKNLKIFYKEYPNSPFIFTLEQINVRELSNKTGIVTQYRTIEDSNYSYINYSLVLVNESYKMMKLDEQYSYNLDVSIIQTRSDNSVEFMDRYYINKVSNR